MNFYVITNGYIEDGYCRVYVVAENDERARQLASEAFKAENESKKTPHPDDYHAADRLIVYRLDEGTENAVAENE